MSNTYDTLDDISVEDRGESSSGGGSGAAIAVILTLLLGLGLVFAAYKLGQRTGVDDPPLLTAEPGPVKVLPADSGGQLIPNTENASNTMIDQRPPLPGGYAVQDGIVVSRELPARDLDVATTIDVGEFQHEEIDLAAIRPSTAITGEPSLTEDGAPGREIERLRPENADVVVAVEGGTAPVASVTGEGTEAGGANAQGIDTVALAPPAPGVLDTAASGAVAQEPGASDSADSGTGDALVTAPDTSVQTGTTQVAGLRTPLPRVKPPLASRPAVPAAASSAPAAPNPASSRVTPVPRVVDPAPAAPVTPVVRAPQAAPAEIPPQPAGDAQVQLGAMTSPEEVRLRWNDLRRTHPDLLGRLGLQVLPVRTANGGSLFRLRVGPLPDGPAAARLCDQLQYRGVACFVPPRT